MEISKGSPFLCLNIFLSLNKTDVYINNNDTHFVYLRKSGDLYVAKHFVRNLSTMQIFTLTLFKIQAMKIKVCGMRNPSNISDLVKLPIDYIGFIFYDKSPRYIGDTEPEDILDLIPTEIKKTGVFVNATEEYILSQSLNYDLQAIQLHGSESPEFCTKIHSLTHKTIIKAFGIDEEFDFSILEKYQDCCDYFLFDTKSKNHGGTGVKFDWNILSKYNNAKPIFLSGGIKANDAAEIAGIKNIDIQVLDLNSKFEIEPALKDTKLLDKFISEVKKEATVA